MIEVGEYLRTKSGLIDRIAYITDTMGDRKLVGFEKSNYCRSDLGIEKDIVKHSKNIIDLIELYDYVNGMIVFDIITYDNGEKELKLSSGYLMSEDEIQDILTHEQYEQNCYNVRT